MPEDFINSRLEEEDSIFFILEDKVNLNCF